MKIRSPFDGFARLSGEQWLQVGLMSTFFLLLMTTFWLLKPIRTSVLLTTLWRRCRVPAGGPAVIPTASQSRSLRCKPRHWVHSAHCSAC